MATAPTTAPTGAESEATMAATATTTGTCRICLGTPELPAKRLQQGAITECCVCACHDAHMVSGAHRAWVATARRQGLTGRGVGYGPEVCGH